MANGQPGLSPLQQFISQYMETAQFIEQQRQAGVQEATVQRQIENQELEMFAGMLPQIREPEQRAAFLDLAIQRNPAAATTLQALSAAVPVSLETRMAEAGDFLTKNDFVDALQTSLGLELTAEQLATLDQREAEMHQQNQQFLAGLAQERELSTANLGLQERELEQTGRLGFGRLGLERELGLGQLSLGQFEAINRFNLGTLDAHVRGGTFPELMRAEQQREINSLREQLDAPGSMLMHPARRQAIDREISYREQAMQRFDDLWNANLANLIGASAAGEFGQLTLAQVVQAREAARRQYDESKDEGSRDEARAVLNKLNTLLNQAGFAQPMLEERGGFGGGVDFFQHMLFGTPRDSRAVPPGGTP